jgi:cell division protein FtsQ
MRERRTGGLAALAIVLVGLGGWLVVNSPVFAVRHIRVLGNLTLTADEVTSLSGASTGDNLFRVSPEDMEESLLRNPWVADVQVEREWPSTIVFRVVERRSAAWARSPDGGRVLVAGDGTVLGPVDEKPNELPSLGSLEAVPKPGGLYPGPRAVLEVAASFPSSLRREVAGVRAGERGVTLRLRLGGTVLYGSSASADAKNAALVSILRRVRNERLEIDYVDLRIPSTPALKPELPPTPTG